MMRQLLLVAIGVLLCASMTNAQSVVFGETFDGCALPTGWTSTTVTGNDPWLFVQNSPDAGNAGNFNNTCMALFDDDYGGGLGGGATASKAELLTPFVDMTAYPSANLEFIYNFRDFQTESFTVDIWDKSTQTWVNLLTESGTSNCGTWGCNYPSFAQDITPYLSDSVQVRFSYDDNGNWGWYVGFDDVQFVFYPPYDVGVTALTTPTLNGCDFSASEPVGVSVTNFGSVTEDSVEMTLWVDGALVSTELWVPVVGIPAFSTSNYQFTAGANLLASGFHTVQVSAHSISGDAATANDTVSYTISKDLVNVFPYIENFDAFDICQASCQNAICGTAFNSFGWKNLESGGGDAIDWNVADGLLPNGNGVTGPDADHTSGNGRFLVLDSDFCNGISSAIAETPCFDLSVIPNPEVSLWYHMFGTSMGTFQLQIDSSGSGVYQTIFTSIGNQGINWKRAKVDLAPYASKVVRFRIIGTIPTGANNTSNIAIDDFLVRENFSFDGTPTVLVSPVDSACSFTSSETIIVEVENLGVDTLENPVMTLWANGTFVATENWVGEILPNSSATYTFTATANLSAPIQHNLQIAAVFANDQFVSNDTSTFLIGVPPINTYPYVQDFDTFTVCNGNFSNCVDGSCFTAFTTPKWLNTIGDGDDTDWNVQTGGTPTVGTGPTSDNTSGTGNYLYIEASSCFNQEAKFETPCFDLSPLTAPNLIFWYHMSGIAMGTATMQIDAGNGWVDIWSKTGDQGTQWNPANITLGSYAGQVVKFRMVGITGNAFTSDIAIDDFKIDEAPANDMAPVSFDLPIIERCEGFSSTETVQVTITNNGASPAVNANLTLLVNGQALVTDVVAGPIASGATYVHTFSQTANLSAIGNFNLQATATISGDAFPVNDNILLSGLNDGASIITNFPYTENFDAWTTCTGGCGANNNGSCANTTVITSPGWQNKAEGDDMDWSISNNGTPTGNTGPAADHTTGTATGKYIYTEGCSNGDESWMVTPCFDLNGMFSPQVRFWYHMLGNTMGTLQMQIDTTGMDNWIPVFQKAGNQGTNWNQAIVNLGGYKDKIARIRFRGVNGGNSSDMAIDDFLLKDNVPNDLQAVSINDLENGCGDDDLFVSVTMYNGGFTNELNYSLTVEMSNSGSIVQTVTDTFTVPFITETYKTVLVGPFATSTGGNFDFKAYTNINNAADFNVTNDSTSASVIKTGLSTLANTTTDTASCGPQSFNLSINGDATEYFWYNDENGGNYINTGTTYTTPVLSDTTDYWIEGRNPFYTSIGRIDTVGGAGEYYDYFADGLRINALFDFTIDSVTVYPSFSPQASASTTANIVINVKDDNGAILKTINVPYTDGTVGKITIPIEVDLKQGKSYSIDADGTTPTNGDFQMWRNGFGSTAYPFIEDGTVRMPGTTNNLGGFYYFFYDIQINYLGCPSPRIPIQLNIGPNDITLDSMMVLSDPASGTGSATIIPTGGSSGYTYAWSTSPVQTTATATNLTAGTYTVTVTDAIGCTAVGSVSVFNVGIDDVFGLDKFNIYPNPTQGLFTIDLELNQASDVQVEIFNSIGQLVYSEVEERIDAKKYAIDFIDKPAGLYQVRIRVNDQIVTKTIMVSGL